MPYSADAIANYFIEKAGLGKLTQMQVQKLCFYAHGWYMALDKEGRPLIGDSVEVWRFGPVFRRLYSEFKEFGAGPITRQAIELQFERVDGKLRADCFTPSIENELPADVDRSLVVAVLERVWELYGGFTAYQLSNLTHSEGEPWRVMRDAMPGVLPRGMHLPNETIRECFKVKLRPGQPA